MPGANDTVATKARWKFIAKFGFAAGGGSWAVRMKPRRRLADFPVQVALYSDEVYAEAAAKPDLCERMPLADSVHRVLLRGPDNITDFKSQTQWSDVVTGTVQPLPHPHVWYFVVTSCGLETEYQSFEEAEATPAPTPAHSKSSKANKNKKWKAKTAHVSVSVELSTKQTTGSEFSYEDSSSYSVELIAVLAGSGFLALFVPAFRKYYDNVESVHATTVLLAVAAGMEYFVHLLQLLHFWRYESNGWGVPWCYYFGEALRSISSVLLLTLMCMIACGYTLTRARLGDSADMYVAAGYAFGAIELLLVLTSELQQDNSGQWYPLDGSAGTVAVVLRLITFGLAVPASYETWGNAKAKVRSFLGPFYFATGVYLLSLPGCMFLASFFERSSRKFVMRFSQTLIQGGVICSLSVQFFTRGTYFRVSTLGSTYLPCMGTFARGDGKLS